MFHAASGRIAAAAVAAGTAAAASGTNDVYAHARPVRRPTRNTIGERRVNGGSMSQSEDDGELRRPFSLEEIDGAIDDIYGVVSCEGRACDQATEVPAREGVSFFVNNETFQGLLGLTRDLLSSAKIQCEFIRVFRENAWVKSQFPALIQQGGGGSTSNIFAEVRGRPGMQMRMENNPAETPPTEDMDILLALLNSILDGLETAAAKIGQKISDFLKSIGTWLREHIAFLAAPSISEIPIGGRFGTHANGNTPPGIPSIGSLNANGLFKGTVFFAVAVVALILATRYLKR